MDNISKRYVVVVLYSTVCMSRMRPQVLAKVGIKRRNPGSLDVDMRYLNC